jgi:hypothetical protein
MTHKRLSDAELQAIGKALRTHARDLSADFRQMIEAEGFVDVDYVIGLGMQLEDTAARRKLLKTHVRVPLVTAAYAAAVLSTMPGRHRGRPRKPSTDEAVSLAYDGTASTRGIAKLIAERTGEPSDQIRSRLKGIKKRQPRHFINSEQVEAHLRDLKRRSKKGG